MNKYRTHNCAELNEKNIGIKIKLSGWIHRKRDHGNLLFIDIRDHFGITQCVIENKNKNFKVLEKIRPESVILVEGKVIKRSKETENKDLKTGLIEIEIENIKVFSSISLLKSSITKHSLVLYSFKIFLEIFFDKTTTESIFIFKIFIK